MNLEKLKEFATNRQSEIIDAVIKHGSQKKAAAELDINSRTLERSLQTLKRNASRRGWSPDHDMTHSVPDTHVVKGVSTFYDEHSNPIRQWVKSDLKKESQEAALQAFADALVDDLPKYKPLPSKPLTGASEALTAYVIGDAHIGMRATKKRNGDSDWNLEIAERVTVGAIEKLVQASGPTEVGVMIQLGDFGHADSLHHTTSSGQNHMDMDGDYGDSVAAQVRVYKRCIDMLLANHEKVIVIIVRGNHDSSTSRCMNVMMQSFYSHEKRLEIRDNASKWQHLEWGNNLLVTHHGDRVKLQRAFEHIVASLSKEWGRCDNRHLIMGHVHHHTSVEKSGMECETFQALPSADNWHSDSGFTGAKRTMSAIVYDKKHGEIQRHKVGINQLGE